MRPRAGEAATGTDVLSCYDDNRNGRNTCKEACRHRIAHVHRSHPAYRYMPDGDGDSPSQDTVHNWPVSAVR